MAENITRCPKCNTSFRVGEAHLNTAKGAVRCGSCLNVFNAREYLVSPKAPELVDFDYARENEDDDVLISDDMNTKSTAGPTIDDEVEEDFGDSIFGSGDTGEYEFSLFERDTIAEDNDDTTPEDESWALDLLKGDEEDRSPPPTTDDTAVESEEQASERHNTEEFETSYYQNSFQIIADDQEEEAPPAKRITSVHDVAKELFNEYDEVGIEEFEHRDTAANVYAQSSQSKSQYLHSIEPEPVEFAWQTHSPIWQSKFLWGSLSLLAGFVLLGQIAWLKFDTLSTVAPYREYYALACNVLSCELPPLIDREKIKTANLVVRSHPNHPNALVVDAVLQNTAKFEQSFPILDLVFTDSQDKIVAARRLLPGDYLGGELAGRTQMPVRQPVHIAIEIADPGREAIGYKISIAD